MIKIYTTSDSLLIHHYRNLLENAGINCQIKQAYLSGGAGELPPIECWPELWIEDDQLQAKAKDIIQASGNQTQHILWQCRCGEKHEQQFNICWKCGGARKDTL